MKRLFPLILLFVVGVHGFSLFCGENEQPWHENKKKLFFNVLRSGVAGSASMFGIYLLHKRGLLNPGNRGLLSGLGRVLIWI